MPLPVINFENVLHVIDSVFELSAGERSSSPIGACLTPVCFASEDTLDDRFITEWEAARTESFRNLHVPQTTRRSIGKCQTEPNLFASAMNDDHRLVVGHEFPPGAEVRDFVRVHCDTPFYGGKLQQTQLRAIGELRDELGVERN